MSIDLKTFKKRSEFIKAWNERELYIDHILNDLDIANERLLEYEGIQTDDDKETEFQKFWVMYGKKGNVKTSRKRFNKLSDKKKALIFKVLPNYIKSTPDKPFRKDGERWLLNECWNDEIIGGDSVKEFHRPKLGAKSYYSKPEATQSTVNVHDRIAKLK